MSSFNGILFTGNLASFCFQWWVIPNEFNQEKAKIFLTPRNSNEMPNFRLVSEIVLELLLINDKKLRTFCITLT